MKREPLNGAAHGLRVVQKQLSANESVIPEEEVKRDKPAKGDIWAVLGMELWPLGAVALVCVVAKVGSELKWW